MQLEMRRVILFTADLERMSHFYGTLLGLPLLSSEKGWREFSAGACRIAIHAGTSIVGTRSPKIVFLTSDVVTSRAVLAERGVKLGKVLSAPGFHMCDGRDPDGNRFQLSSRP